MTDARPWLACACLALSMSLVGSYVALSRPLVAIFPVMLLAWLRFGIGALAMLPWLRRPAQETPMTVRIRGLLFAEAFLGNFLFSVFMLSGMRLTSAVSAGVIMAAIPAMVALMSRLVLGERVAAPTWLAIACAALGMALLASRGAAPAAGGAQAWLGNLLVFGAVLCEAAYAVIGKLLTGALGPRRITALVNLWGLALATPFGLWSARAFDFGAVPPGPWALLVFYALAASVWTVWLWMTGLRQVPAAQAGVFTVMLPACAALVGVLALGEPWGWRESVAIALALVGVLLATRTAQAATGSREAGSRPARDGATGPWEAGGSMPLPRPCSPAANAAQNSRGKKRQPPMKSAIFRLETRFFSFSIRSATGTGVRVVIKINF